MTVTFFITSTIMPVKKADAAWPLVLGAGVEVGAGAFALGALAVGSLATAVGLEHGDAIKQKGTDVWNGANAAIMSSARASMEASKNAGEKLVKFGEDVTSWLSGKTKELAGFASSLLVKDVEKALPVKQVANSDIKRSTYNDLNPEQFQATKFPVPFVYLSASPLINDVRSYFSYRQTHTSKLPTHYFLINDSYGLGVFEQITFYYNRVTGQILNFNMSNVVADKTPTYTSANKWVDPLTSLVGKNISEFGYTHEALQSAIENVVTAEQLLSLLLSFGITNVQVAEVDTILEKYNQATNKMATQDIPAMKDAGMVIPATDIAAHPANDKTVTLTWDATQGVYTLPDGTIFTGDRTYSFPAPYVGTTGQVLVDTADGVTTNVNTGEVVSAPTTGGTDGGLLQGLWDWLKGILQKILDAIVALASLTGIIATIDLIKNLVTTIADTITTGLIGEPANINWSKLKTTGNAFTTKFPFSIPWDVGRALESIFGAFSQTTAPVWVLKFNVLGNQYSWDLKFPQIVIDWQPFYKSAILIMFDISLVYSVRKMLGGAS